MEVKYELWGRVSHAIEERDRDALPVDGVARGRFERIPDFVRGQVLEAVEGNARTLGLSEVNDAVVDLVIAQWIDTGDFHEGRYGFNRRGWSEGGSGSPFGHPLQRCRLRRSEFASDDSSL